MKKELDIRILRKVVIYLFVSFVCLVFIFTSINKELNEYKLVEIRMTQYNKVDAPFAYFFFHVYIFLQIPLAKNLIKQRSKRKFLVVVSFIFLALINLIFGIHMFNLFTLMELHEVSKDLVYSVYEKNIGELFSMINYMFTIAII